MKLVYVTGCLGFIGSYVTMKCLERGWKVYGVDKCTYVANKNLLLELEKNPTARVEELKRAVLEANTTDPEEIMILIMDISLLLVIQLALKIRVKI